ncbi:MAG: hypothetical protein HRT37_15060 [Alteromonadaceae bacterium]|nr:hypothetical protein [Alteromonadaceae bacterium]
MGYLTGSYFHSEGYDNDRFIEVSNEIEMILLPEQKIEKQVEKKTFLLMIMKGLFIKAKRLQV